MGKYNRDGKVRPQARPRLHKKAGSIAAAAIFTCFAVSGAQAQDDDALSIKVGETDLYPAVKVQYAQDSNGFLTADNEIEATAVTVSPELRWIAGMRRVSIEALYQGEYENNSEKSLNHADHLLSLSSRAEFSVRKRASASVSFERGHESLGTNLTRDLPNTDADQIMYNRLNVGGRFVYGASRARGNIEAGLNITNFSYANRRDVTSGRDFTSVRPYGLFSLRAGADTRLLAELRFESTSFDDSSRDRDDLSLLGGIEFAATGKSGGTAKVGLLSSDPSQAGVSKSTDFILEGSLFWEPSKRSRFTLTALRELSNINISLNPQASAAVQDTVSLDWNHAYSTRVSHYANLSNQNLTRDCPDGDVQSIDASFELNVQVRRWLSVGAAVATASEDPEKCADRADPDAEIGFDQQRIGVHFRATL